MNEELPQASIDLSEMFWGTLALIVNSPMVQSIALIVACQIALLLLLEWLHRGPSLGKRN